MLDYAAKTHPGLTHDNNEDSVGCDPERGVWLVADGMGGHAAGEVASRVAVDVILERVAQGDGLKEATLAAHRAVVQQAGDDVAKKGMGSTSVVLRIGDRQGEVVWVGDSRAYRLRGGEFKQLTKDHSFMQLLLDRQHLTEEQARTHPRRNVVTQVLGFNEPEPDQVHTELQHDDLLVLCSDGLYDELTNEEIALLLGTADSLDDQAERLIQAACARGGRDNVSVVLVRYSSEDAATLQRTFNREDVPAVAAAAEEQQDTQRERGLPAGVLWGALAAVLIGIIVFMLGGQT